MKWLTRNFRLSRPAAARWKNLRLAPGFAICPDRHGGLILEFLDDLISLRDHALDGFARLSARRLLEELEYPFQAFNIALGFGAVIKEALFDFLILCCAHHLGQRLQDLLLGTNLSAFPERDRSKFSRMPSMVLQLQHLTERSIRWCNFGKRSLLARASRDFDQEFLWLCWPALTCCSCDPPWEAMTFFLFLHCEAFAGLALRTDR